MNKYDLSNPTQLNTAREECIAFGDAVTPGLTDALKAHYTKLTHVSPDLSFVPTKCYSCGANLFHYWLATGRCSKTGCSKCNRSFVD